MPSWSRSARGNGRHGGMSGRTRSPVILAARGRGESGGQRPGQTSSPANRRQHDHGGRGRRDRPRRAGADQLSGGTDGGSTPSTPQAARHADRRPRHRHALGQRHRGLPPRRRAQRRQRDPWEAAGGTYDPLLGRHGDDLRRQRHDLRLRPFGDHPRQRRTRCTRAAKAPRSTGRLGPVPACRRQRRLRPHPGQRRQRHDHAARHFGGHNTVMAGAGDDYFAASSAGHDYLDGGAGRRHLLRPRHVRQHGGRRRFDHSPSTTAPAPVSDTLDGGAGHDTVWFQGRSSTDAQIEHTATGSHLLPRRLQRDAHRHREHPLRGHGPVELMPRPPPGWRRARLSRRPAGPARRAVSFRLSAMRKPLADPPPGTLRNSLLKTPKALWGPSLRPSSKSRRSDVPGRPAQPASRRPRRPRGGGSGARARAVPRGGRSLEPQRRRAGASGARRGRGGAGAAARRWRGSGRDFGPARRTLGLVLRGRATMKPRSTISARPSPAIGRTSGAPTMRRRNCAPSAGARRRRRTLRALAGATPLPHALRALGSAARERGDGDGRLAALRVAADLLPADPWFALDHAETLIALAAWRGRAALLQLRERHPRFAGAVRARMRLAARRGDPATRLAEAESSPRSTPTRAPSISPRRSSTPATRRRPRPWPPVTSPPRAHPRAFRLLMRCARQAGDGERALAHARAALQLAPDDAALRAERAQEALALGRTAEAEAEARAALALDPALAAAAGCSRKACARAAMRPAPSPSCARAGRPARDPRRPASRSPPICARPGPSPEAETVYERLAGRPEAAAEGAGRTGPSRPASHGIGCRPRPAGGGAGARSHSAPRPSLPRRPRPRERPAPTRRGRPTDAPSRPDPSSAGPMRGWRCWPKRGRRAGRRGGLARRHRGRSRGSASAHRAGAAAGRARRLRRGPRASRRRAAALPARRRGGLGARPHPAA